MADDTNHADTRAAFNDVKKNRERRAERPFVESSMLEKTVRAGVYTLIAAGMTAITVALGSLGVGAYHHFVDRPKIETAETAKKQAESAKKHAEAKADVLKKGYVNSQTQNKVLQTQVEKASEEAKAAKGVADDFAIIAGDRIELYRDLQSQKMLTHKISRKKKGLENLAKDLPLITSVPKEGFDEFERRSPQYARASKLFLSGYYLESDTRNSQEAEKNLKNKSLYDFVQSTLSKGEGLEEQLLGDPFSGDVKKMKEKITNPAAEKEYKAFIEAKLENAPEKMKPSFDALKKYDWIKKTSDNYASRIHERFDNIDEKNKASALGLLWQLRFMSQGALLNGDMCRDSIERGLLRDAARVYESRKAKEFAETIKHFSKKNAEFQEKLKEISYLQSLTPDNMKDLTPDKVADIKKRYENVAGKGTFISPDLMIPSLKQYRTLYTLELNAGELIMATRAINSPFGPYESDLWDSLLSCKVDFPDRFSISFLNQLRKKYGGEDDK